MPARSVVPEGARRQYPRNHSASTLAAAPRRRGKSDPIDACAAAQQALAEPEALPLAKTGEGLVEQVRVLSTIRRSAVKARVAVIRQIKSLLVIPPETIRTRWERASGHRVIEELAATRPGDIAASVDAATGHALRRLARRHQGVRRDHHGTLLVTAGSNPERLRSETSFAALCGTSPIPTSSGRRNDSG